MLQEDEDEMETAEMKFLDFPDEILLKIFCNLSDHTLQQVSRVCKKLKMIAEASFATKYNGISEEAFYLLKISGKNYTDEQKQYEPIFRKFGDKMGAIKIDFLKGFVDRNHWIILLIQRYCKSLRKVTILNGKKVDVASIICYMPNLTHLSLKNLQFLNQKWTEYTHPKLVNFSASDCNGDYKTFAVFIDYNQQLEHLTSIRFIEKSNNFLCTVNDKLNKLTTLELVGDKAGFRNKSSTLRMKSLKALTVKVNKNSFVPLLEAIRDGLPTIEEFKIHKWSHYKLTVGDIKLLCSFDMLKTLILTGVYELSFELLKMLITKLPNLISFSLRDAKNLSTTHDDLLNVILVCQQLALLHLNITTDLPIVDYNFCTRFADIMDINGSDLKLELFNVRDKMIFTREEVRLIKYWKKQRIPFHNIIYWKGYDAASTAPNKNLFELNTKILKKIVAFLDGNDLSSFYQTCGRAQQVVMEHLKENVFHCAVTPTKCTNENVFMVLGEYIHRMYIDMEHYSFDDVDDDEDIVGTPSHELKLKFMRCVNQYCGKRLMEIEINDSIQSNAMLYWPNLRKLKFDTIDNSKLQQFHCPELTDLVIDEYYHFNVNVSIDNSFPKLTNLTFDSYDESVDTFLCGLHRTLCTQINSLSLKGTFEKMCQRSSWLKLTNSVGRFERLTTLHLHVNGIVKSNFKLLFEKCTMLVELLIFHDYTLTNRDKCWELFRTIKMNCKQLEIIKLVGKSSCFWQSTSLQMIYAMFPNAIINVIDSGMDRCLCTLKNKFEQEQKK